MNWFNTLPNHTRAAPGLEWSILKKLPLVLLAGILLPLGASLAWRIFPPQGDAAHIEKAVTSVDILCIASAATVCMAVFTIAIGCFMVVVMKGPAYVADAYELVDSERPGSRP